MFWWLWNYLKGYVIIKVSGFSAERFINLCALNALPLWDIKSCGRQRFMKASYRALDGIFETAGRCGCTVEIISTHGLPYILKRVGRKKVLSAGIAVFALIILGASLKFSSLKSNFKYIISGIAARLIIVPVIATSIAYLIGFRDMQIFVVLIVTSTPVAASAYTMAYTMESDHVLTAQYVALSTVFSVFTIFGFLMTFMTLGLF